MARSRLPRLAFAHLPTPIELLPRLSAAVGGPRLSVKRDDQTGLALGGNKARKLEFLLAEAQANGARTLITTGAAQSNQCRQTAAAASRFGFDCILVLPGAAPPAANGNLLLDHLLGAEVIWSGTEAAGDAMQRVFDEAWAAGRRPYRIPYGASSPVGAAGYIAAMFEFMDQAAAADVIIVASSSGGTQAGMVAGARLAGFKGRVIGVSVDVPAGELQSRVAQLASESASVWGQPMKVTPEEVEVTDRYIGGGYGVLGELEREAIRLFARTEGLLLDPVYTARAAGGMIDMVRRGELKPGEQVLFWHTGGYPALFAYADQLANPNPSF
jgi:D-cysteine desulfhydrase family pyridoxal phosphate-dependent enzyme